MRASKGYRHPRLAAGLIATLGGLLIGCAPGPAGNDRPDLVLVTLDTTRADHCSFLGYARETTPRLAALAGEGVSFHAAYTPTPTTGPAHASLLTGTHPRTHGVLRNAWLLPPERETLAEVLAAAGYTTAAVVSGFPLARRFGFAQGFGHYDDEFLPAEASLDPGEWDGIALPQAFDRRARATTDRALRWLAAAPPNRPFLLWVHYYDPHAPYDPPPRYHELFSPTQSESLAQKVAQYDAEIRFADDEIGRLLDGIVRKRSLDQTLVVIATDHGEGLMQHGWLEHGINLYEELVRVALVFRWPARIAPGRTSAVPVSLIDVYPTVLALLGLARSDTPRDGSDLSPLLLHGVAPSPERALYFQRRFYTTGDRAEWPARGEMAAIRAGRWKYVEADDEGSRYLFDLSSDPHETRTLLSEHPTRAAELAALLRAWREAPGGHATPEQPISEDDRRRLRALGYLD